LFKKPHCPVIAIEEHYWDDELEKTFTGGEAGRRGEQYTRLKDLGALRLKEMDEAGIDIQVLSHGAPSTQKLPADTAAAVARRVNDRLHAVVSKNRRLRRAADRGARGCGGGIRAHRRARVQGRHAARPRRRGLPRRQKVLADLCP